MCAVSVADCRLDVKLPGDMTRQTSRNQLPHNLLHYHTIWRNKLMTPSPCQSWQNQSQQ